MLIIGAVPRTVTPSISAEIAWLLDLLVQTAPYAEPALDELDRSLLPGVAALGPSIQTRFRALWNDSTPGCPELLIAVGQAQPLEAEAGPVLASFSTLPKHPSRRFDLLSEAPASRRQIRRRLERLNSDVRIRRTYRDLLAEVWALAGPAWERRGRTSAARACAEWTRRLGTAVSSSAVVRLMPPRHPLAAVGRAAAGALVSRRRELVVVPVYFCMSGGQVADLGDRLVIGVPASAHEPVRRARDAAFVADRARILAEPTRVHILIHLMSTPSGVMEIARALRMSQPVVSEHVRVLTTAGLLRKASKGSRTTYFAKPGKLDRHIEDARATLARWG